MGNYSEWLRKKRLKEMQDKTDDSLLPFGAYQKKQRERQNQDLAPMRSQSSAPSYDIAPETKERSWFEKGAFEDGYQFGDITKTFFGSTQDLALNVSAGILGMGEKVVDAGAYLVGLFGDDEFKDEMGEFIARDLYDEKEVALKVAKANPYGYFAQKISSEILGIDMERDSVFGDKSDSVAESAGQLLGQIGLQTVGVPWWVTSAVTSFGSAAEEAFANDASYLEAGINSVISAGAEMLTEKLFAGSGLGEKGLIKTDWLTRGISNKVMQTLAKFGVNMATEGGEEVASSFIQNLGKAVTYKREEEIDEILTDSAKFSSFIDNTANQLFGDEAKAEYGEAFVGGAILGGGVNAGKLGNALKYKVDYDTGFTASEQKVFEKALKDRIAEEEKGGKKLSAKEKANIEEAIKTKLRKGYFTIDEIEDIVGGESYNSYKDSIKRQTALKEQESSLRAEIEALYKELPQKRDGARLTAAEGELKSVTEELSQIDPDSLKKKASEDILNTLMFERRGEGSMLLESYSEVARKRQKLSVDTSKMDAKKAAIYKRHMESDLWNNTNRSHDFVDLLVELEAERGIKIDGIDTARLSEAGFTVEGATVNGVKTKNGEVLINLQSSKSLNSVLGHEITHVLEGTDAYKVLKDAVVKYAKSKGEYDKRLTDITKLYKKAEGADIDAELTADLVGDYLFTDEGFIKSLTEHKNLFQRIFDEIKYFCSIAVKGSNEETKLLKIKRAFEKALTSINEEKMQVKAQFDLSKNAEKDLHNALYNMSYRNEVLLRDQTPDILSSQKGVRNLPMTMKVSHIRENVFTEAEAKNLGLRVDEHTHYHGIGEKYFLKIIDGLDNVTEAYRGTKNAEDTSRRENYFLLISQFPDSDGNIINVPVYIDQLANHNRTMIDVNKISTVFGRDEFRNYINRQIKAGNLVRIKNKSTQTSERNALIAKGYGMNASNNIISDSSKKSTENSKKVENREDYSLSGAAEGDIAPMGRYDVRGDDVAYVGDDLAPLKPEYSSGGAQYSLSGGPVLDDDLPLSEKYKEDRDFDKEERESDSETDADTSNVSVSEKIAIKIENFKKELENNIKLRAESIEHFDSEIRRIQSEYDLKKNKNTAVANKMLRSIERLQRMKDNIDAEYADRIDNIEERIKKLSTPEYRRGEQRKAKQKAYRAEVSELMGDISTWKDRALGISYQTNTLQRNLREVVRDADGKRDIAKADKIYEYLQGDYNHHEAQLKRESQQIKKPLADMKINNHEAEYAQMLGELKYNPETTIKQEDVAAYYSKHKNQIDTAKVDKAIEYARKVYDELLPRINAVLREQGMKEIPYREGYFPHFTDQKQGFLGKLLNWKTQNNDIPTDIAGLTEQFNPSRSWQSFNKERVGDETDYNLLKGFDTYVHGALDWIYHIEDIQKRRAFENEIRYVHSAKGIQEEIDKILANTDYDADEVQEKMDGVWKKAKNPLNNFVTDLRNSTNNLAGKKSTADRGLEYDTNRKIYSTMTNVSNRVSANMVVGSISAALTNFIPITQSWGMVSPISSIKAAKDMIKNTIRSDGMIEKSDFMTNRLIEEENLYKTGWDKAGKVLGGMMTIADRISTEIVWRSKFIENMKKGMSESEAIHDADLFAEKVMAGRSRGNMPTIYNSKHPAIKLITAFQLEVANQYGYMFKDMPQDIGKEHMGKLVGGYAKMFIGAYVYNALYSALTGRDAAFDPLGIIEDLLQDLGFGDDEEEETDVFAAVEGLAQNIAEELPYVGGILGGGRFPISSAFPDFDQLWESTKGLFTEEDKLTYGKKFIDALSNPFFYGVLPMGGGQLRKTIQGLSMFDDDLPLAGSYTDSGNLRFPVEDTPLNVAQAAIFGQYASKNAREYFDNDFAPIKSTQIDDFIESGKGYVEYQKDKKKKSESSKSKDSGNGGAEDVNYEDILDELKGIRANTNIYGESIKNSKMLKTVAYLNELDIPYGEKLILYKQMFPKDRKYDGAIYDYLVSTNNPDIDEILEDLGIR